jgi:hypothetical protein
VFTAWYELGLYISQVCCVLKGLMLLKICWCKVMSRDRNAGQGHSVKIDNSSAERVEVFKYLGTMLTDQILFKKKLRAD